MEKDWKSAVQKLAEQIESWVSKDFSRPGSLILHELTMDPTPDEPLVEIEVDRRQILRLEPAAFAAGRLPTNVYFYAYPTLRRAVLIGPDELGNWDIQSGEGVSMNYDWNSQGFMQLLRALVESPVSRSL